MGGLTDNCSRENSLLKTCAAEPRGLKLVWNLIRYAPLTWLTYRVRLELEHKIGTFQRKLPHFAWEHRPLASWLRQEIPAAAEEYELWRREHGGKFFISAEQLTSPALAAFARAAVPSADAILDGNWTWFSHSARTGFPPDWHFNVSVGINAPCGEHWSAIDDFSYGDIKYIWELSRFTWSFTLARAYVATRDDKYAEGFWQLLADWCEKNPPHLGVNWKCGQEASFRIMALSFGLHVFRESAASTPDRLAALAQMVAALAERVAGHIHYAQSQKNNHAISEGVGLWTTGLLFPEFAASVVWRELGRSVIEEEVSRQIYSDGSYVQHSVNYHRLMLDDLIWAVRLGQANGFDFSTTFHERAIAAAHWLRAMTDTETGNAPNYGPNDGANILPLANADFGDYRPAVQRSIAVLLRQRTYPTGPWDESALWMGAELPWDVTRFGAKLAFPQGGYYQLVRENKRGVIRCSRYIDRPSQADQLHLDIWWRGENVACDAGTYLYNGEAPWQNSLSSTGVHNTVTIDSLDQMTRAGRFLWLRWAKGSVARFAELANDGVLFEGSHDGYKRLGVSIHRAVALTDQAFIVVDDVILAQEHNARLQWLLPDVPFALSDTSLSLCLNAGLLRMSWIHTAAATTGLVRAGKAIHGSADADTSIRGWRSLHYGEKTPGLSFTLSATIYKPARIITVFDFATEARIPKLSSKDCVLELGTQCLFLFPLGEQFLIRSIEATK